jgi:transcriptional regulator with XRE-family HTH domain
MIDPAAALPNPSAASSVGSLLRAHREQLGLSLREVAQKVGVSASLISQVERDKVNPSVGTLYALATALGVTMGELFDEQGATTPALAAAPESVEPLTEAPALDGQPDQPLGPVAVSESRATINLDSGVRWERLTAAPDPLVDFVYLVYDVGASSDDDVLLTHPGKEYGYVITGELGVRIGFDEYHLRPGDSISFDSTVPHRLWAIGTTPACAIWFALGRHGELADALTRLEASGTHVKPARGRSWT